MNVTNKAREMLQMSLAFARGVSAAVRARVGPAPQSLKTDGYTSAAKHGSREKGDPGGPGAKLGRLAEEGSLTFCHRPGKVGRKIRARQASYRADLPIPNRHPFWQ